MTDSNSSLFERAVRVIPGGVNSPVRAFGSVGGTPYFVQSGDGPYIWDAEGRRYIDYVQSYGPGILGHAHPAVVEAITRAAAEGTSYGAPTEAEARIQEPHGPAAAPDEPVCHRHLHRPGSAEAGATG